MSLLRSLLTLRITHAAVLTSQVTGQPVAGQTIVFTISQAIIGSRTCTAVTNSAGLATCTTSVLGITGILLGGSTTARYAGTANYQSSTAMTPFQVL